MLTLSCWKANHALIIHCCAHLLLLDMNCVDGLFQAWRSHADMVSPTHCTLTTLRACSYYWICLPSFCTDCEMYLQVADQLPRPSKDPEGLAGIGKWMSAADLVLLIHSAERQSEAQLQQQGVTVQTSRDLHDAALAAMTFSHLPPVRLSCIRGLVVPTYTGQPAS